MNVSEYIVSLIKENILSTNDIFNHFEKFKKFDINASINGKSLLMLAVEYNNLEIFKKLLKCDDINIDIYIDGLDSLTTTVLLKDKFDFAEELFKHESFSINVKHEQQRNTLEAIAGFGSLKALEFILKHENDNMPYIFRPLVLINSIDDPEKVKLLLNCKNIDVNSVAKDGVTALIAASASYKFTESLKLLTAHKDIDINKRQDCELNALETALFHMNIEACEHLIKCKGISPVLSDTYYYLVKSMPITIHDGILKKYKNEEVETSNEEVETSNEEVKTSNEEVKTSNEEVKTSNEEVETSNEEVNFLNIDLPQTIKIKYSDTVELEYILKGRTRN